MSQTWVTLPASILSRSTVGAHSWKCPPWCALPTARASLLGCRPGTDPPSAARSHRSGVFPARSARARALRAPARARAPRHRLGFPPAAWAPLRQGRLRQTGTPPGHCWKTAGTPPRRKNTCGSWRPTAAPSTSATSCRSDAQGSIRHASQNMCLGLCRCCPQTTFWSRTRRGPPPALPSPCSTHHPRQRLLIFLPHDHKTKASSAGIGMAPVAQDV